MTSQIRVASETDLDTLIHLAIAFRDHLGQSLPSDTDFRQSIAMLLKDAGTEFVLARDILGTTLGYVQLRYRHSMWTSALEAELEMSLWGARHGGGGWGGGSWSSRSRMPSLEAVGRLASTQTSAT